MKMATAGFIILLSSWISHASTQKAYEIYHANKDQNMATREKAEAALLSMAKHEPDEQQRAEFYYWILRLYTDRTDGDDISRIRHALPYFSPVYLHLNDPVRISKLAINWSSYSKYYAKVEHEMSEADCRIIAVTPFLLAIEQLWPHIETEGLQEVPVIPLVTPAGNDDPVIRALYEKFKDNAFLERQNELHKQKQSLIHHAAALYRGEPRNTDVLRDLALKYISSPAIIRELMLAADPDCDVSAIPDAMPPREPGTRPAIPPELQALADEAARSLERTPNPETQDAAEGESARAIPSTGLALAAIILAALLAAGGLFLIRARRR